MGGLGCLERCGFSRVTDARETPPSGEFIVYEASDGNVGVDVRLEQETVWLSQGDLATVLDTTSKNILMHLRNVYSSEELEIEATSKDFLLVRGRRVTEVGRRSSRS